ncbi:hypothetical protein Y032_0005g2473 [Ancylostoma ceylanicum]|uniref:Uncharacterized protein n=1 Tax=Ancylostoma ceylanicum TaxID=53326 RepID=A0A016VS61_9BILA|nr:hypothetical protein Y032_0005g2473 [Ancylostoma ceylanicum]
MPSSDLNVQKNCKTIRYTDKQSNQPTILCGPDVDDDLSYKHSSAPIQRNLIEKETQERGTGMVDLTIFLSLAKE